MPKKLEVLGLTPDMEKYKMEREKPEKAEFKPKSFEELKQIGDKRLEAGRDKVFSFKNKIKERMIGLFSKIGSVGRTGLESAGKIKEKAKGISKETLRTVAAIPDIVKEGKNLAGYKAGQAFEAVADKVEGSVNAAGEFVSEKCRGAVDGAKAGYNKLENRAVGTYIRFQDKVEELRKEIDFDELRQAQENVFEAKKRFNDLLVKNQMRWGTNIEDLQMGI